MIQVSIIAGTSPLLIFLERAYSIDDKNRIFYTMWASIMYTILCMSALFEGGLNIEPKLGLKGFYIKNTEMEVLVISAFNNVLSCREDLI